MKVAENIRFKTPRNAGFFHLDQPLASPSLWKRKQSAGRITPAKQGAFEIKFLADESLAVQLVATVSTRMQLDPHADPQTLGYAVEGIYFETPEFDVFKRTQGYSRRKFRIRKYGSGETMFLERKSKRQGVVTKRRCQLEWNELKHVLSNRLAIESEETRSVEVPTDEHNQSELSWFSSRIHRLRLRPTLCIAYERVAFLQMEEDYPIRLTIDRGLSCCPFAHASFPAKLDYCRFLEGMCVIELKYRETMPGSFREWIDDFKLISQPVSKFRNAILATGLIESLFIPPLDGVE